LISIESAVKEYESDLVERTLCFLLKDGKVLLGHKKTGFGKGYIVGIGGGVDDGETPIEAAIREVEEEVFITPSDLHFVGVLDFYFPYVDNPRSWNQRVFVYRTSTWTGTVTESEEIKPEWYSVNELPFNKMWDDANYWLNDILAGNAIWAQFTFNSELKVESHKNQLLEYNQELTSKGMKHKNPMSIL
jgi:8-oxo-dGTP diphosphatase